MNSDRQTEDEFFAHYRELLRAYNEANQNYQRERAQSLHKEILETENKGRLLRNQPQWKRTELEKLSLSALIKRFGMIAIEHDEAADPTENERLYWKLENVIDELMRRNGDQRRALFGLYTDADIRVRAAAADATRTLAPILSKDRLLFIDDESWSPPIDGADIVNAGLEEFFAKPYRGAPKRAELEKLSTWELVERFTEISLQQHEAEELSEIPKYNRLFSQMQAIEEEFRRRGNIERQLLLPLLNHPNAQVRFNASINTLIIDPQAARQTLRTISDRNEYPQAANARGMMRALDEWRYVPR